MVEFWEPERPSPETLCFSIFDLEFPPEESELKSRFRERTLKGEFRHPDRGGTDKGFRELKEAYDFLLPFCNLNTKVVVETRTNDGFLISDLGKGLGSTVNGTECETCIGKGYYSVTRFEYPRTSRSSTCRSCNGLGYAYKRRSKNYFGYGDTFICLNCMGLGELNRERKEVTRIYKCSKCEGKGETRVFNPAFQKGAMSLGNKRPHNKKQKKEVVKNPLFKYRETV